MVTKSKKKMSCKCCCSSVRAPGRVCSVCCIVLCKACAAGSDTWPKAAVRVRCYCGCLYVNMYWWAMRRSDCTLRELCRLYEQTNGRCHVWPCSSVVYWLSIAKQSPTTLISSRWSKKGAGIYRAGAHTLGPGEIRHWPGPWICSISLKTSANRHLASGVIYLDSWRPAISTSLPLSLTASSRNVKGRRQAWTKRNSSARENRVDDGSKTKMRFGSSMSTLSRRLSWTTILHAVVEQVYKRGVPCFVEGHL